jgi:hypothetical protein
VIEVSDETSRWTAARITGTFSFISTYGVFLQFVWLCGIGLLLRPCSFKRAIVIGAGMGLILANMFMTGSRGVVLVSLVFSIPFGWLWLSNALRTNARLTWRFWGIICFWVFALIVIPVLMNAVVERSTQAEDSNKRIMGSLLMPVYTLDQASLMGSGIGETFLGIGEVQGTSGIPDMQFEEIVQDRVGVEFGTLGYLFFLMAKVLFAFSAFKLFLSARSEYVRVWSTVFLMYQLEFLWQIPVYNAVAAIFYFASIGGIAVLSQHNARRASAVPTVPQRRAGVYLPAG